MKIRNDFVTNSSSSSFGISLIAAIMVMITTGCTALFIQWLEQLAALQASAGSAGDVPPHAGPEEPEFEEVTGDEDADPAGDYDDSADLQDDDLDDFGMRDLELQQEIEHYEQEWEQLSDQLDPDSPDYDQARQEYDDYIEHLEWQRHEIEMERYEQEVESYREQARQAAEEQWVRQRQDELRDVMEQAEFTRAARDGYGASDFDVTEHDRRLDQLADRERKLREQLVERDADIDYQARDRDTIGPSEHIREVRREAEIARQVEEKIARRAWNRQYEFARGKRDQGLRDFERFSARGDRWERLERGAEYTLKAADTGVDALATVTGPAGKTVKATYQGARGVASGVGRGMAEGGDYARHIGQGALEGASDIVKDRLKGPKRAIFTVGSESARAGLDAYMDDEDVLTGMGRGAMRGGVEAAGHELGNKYLPTTEMDVDYADLPVSSVVDVPREVGRTVLDNTIKSETVKTATDVGKGEDIPFTNWNHGMLK